MEFDDMLRVTVMGNLGSDAEVRFSARENRIASFRIAVNQVRTDSAGERQDSTEWFRVNVMGRQAEYASHLLKRPAGPGRRTTADHAFPATGRHARRRVRRVGRRSSERWWPCPRRRGWPSRSGGWRR